MGTLLEAGRIAPPAEHFELGDRVRYHHRAAVARLPDIRMDKGVFTVHGFEASWDIVESEGGRPAMFFEETRWLQQMRRTGKLNKTIVVWPAEGEGFVFGLIRRGIGRSVRGYESGYEYPEWNPGYFEADEWHWLYAIKNELAGMKVIYVPLWAAQKIEKGDK